MRIRALARAAGLQCTMVVHLQAHYVLSTYRMGAILHFLGHAPTDAHHDDEIVHSNMTLESEMSG